MKYEMPALTNEQRRELIETCQEVLAAYEQYGPHTSTECDIYRIALAALTAERVGYVSNVSRKIADDGGMGYISNHIVAGLEGGYVYTAPPVPALNLPGEWSERIYDQFDTGYDSGWNDCLAEVKHLNGVK